MNTVNPHYFSAILNEMKHRFILILECESVQGMMEQLANCPPRFCIGGINASKDPRLCIQKQLLELDVACENLDIPHGMVMAHQYMYVVHNNTDEQGWQYRSAWQFGPLGGREEPWTRHQMASSVVRRRLWMVTLVERENFVHAKRLLSENTRIDNGEIKKEGELMRYEKGTITKSWHRRKVVLRHNRIEFYSGNTKKNEVSLVDCEVKMLFESQCPGRSCAFSVRNPQGTVSLVLDADTKESRLSWVMAIQYQLAMISYDLNFPPLEYAPPTGEYPDNRVLVCGNLMLHNKDPVNGSLIWTPRHFELHSREIVYYDQEQMVGRLFLIGAQIVGEERNLNFRITSASGITLTLSADSPEAKNQWLLGVRRQIHALEDSQMRQRFTPKEELRDPNVSISERIAIYYDDRWTAPAVDGEDEDYLKRVFDAPLVKDPESVEFTEHVTMAPPERPTAEMKDNLASTDNAGAQHRNLESRSSSSGALQKQQSMTVPEKNNETTAAPSLRAQSSFAVPSDQLGRTHSSIDVTPADKPRSSGALLPAKHSHSTLSSHRALINPKFILKMLKGTTHRFLLVLESESRVKNTSPASVEDNGNYSFTTSTQVARFTVGGPRASKDPRTTQLNELLPISNKRPEIQLPPGWVMAHQYIYIVQQNTDDNGWQYRSTWSDGALTAKDEQWTEVYDEEVHTVRRRLWMTTVVKKDDVIRCKKVLHDQLNQPRKDPIMQGSVYRYHHDLGRLSNSWQRRKMMLYHSHLEFYIGNEKKGEASLENCEVNILYGDQCPGRSHAFTIRSPNLSTNLLLEADSDEARLQWVRAITYQLAVISPDVNFPPFPYGPPTGHIAENRILYCGDLFKDDSKYIFQLRPFELMYYRKDHLLGRFQIVGAVLKPCDAEDEFIILTSSGYELHLKADNVETKIGWMRALKRQALWVEQQKMRVDNTPVEEVEGDNLGRYQRLRGYYDTFWFAPDVNEAEEDDFFNGHESALLESMQTEVWDREERDYERVSLQRPASTYNEASSRHSSARNSVDYDNRAPVASHTGATSSISAAPAPAPPAAPAAMQPPQPVRPSEPPVDADPHSKAIFELSREESADMQARIDFEQSESYDGEFAFSESKSREIESSYGKMRSTSTDVSGTSKGAATLQDVQLRSVSGHHLRKPYQMEEKNDSDDEEDEDAFAAEVIRDVSKVTEEKGNEQESDEFNEKLENLKKLRKRQSMLATGEVKTHVTRIMQEVEKSSKSNKGSSKSQ